MISFGSEKLKGIPKKVKLMEAVPVFLRNYWEVLVHREGGGMSFVTNEAVSEAGK